MQWTSSVPSGLCLAYDTQLTQVALMSINTCIDKLANLMAQTLATDKAKQN